MPMHDDALQQVLDVLFELLKKLGIIPKNADKKEVVASVKLFMEENDMRLNPEDLKKPETKNTLCTALTITAVCGNTHGTKELLKLLNLDNRSPEQNSKLTLGLAYVSVMQKNPQLKLDMDLLFKNPQEMNPKEKEQLHNDLTLVFAASNEKEIDLKLGIQPQDAAAVKALVDMTMAELEKPGNTAELIQSGALQKDQMEKNLFGGGVGPIAANALGVPDQFPAYSANSPIHALSGTILSPSQAATGEFTLAESRDISDDFGDINSEEADIGVKYRVDDEPIPDASASKLGDILDDLASLTAEAGAGQTGENNFETDLGFGKESGNENSSLHEQIDNAFEANNIRTDKGPPTLKPPGSSH